MMRLVRHLLIRAYLAVLRRATRHQLAKFSPHIVGVTGSNGKSTAARAIATVLATTHETISTQTGNSETGVPFELLHIPIKHYNVLGYIGTLPRIVWEVCCVTPHARWAVLELGIDSDHSPKNMEHHLQMMQPLVGVLLSVSDVHAANYHSAHPREAIAREKAKLLQALPQNGLAVASCDYPEIVQSATGISAPMVWFSREESGGDTHGAAPLNVQCRLLAYHLTPTGTTFTLSFEGTTYTLAFSNQVHSRGSFGSFAAALIVGKFAGVAPEVALSALSQHMQLPPGRMSVLAGLRGATLLDSSYNASPDSMRDALQLLQQFPTTGRRIVILGDMRELGVSSAVAHESIGQAALSVADVIVLVGPEMGDHAWPVIQSADDDARRKLQKVSPHRWYTNAYAALEYVQDLVQANDVVLIKGSQNTIFLEILVAALLAHPERDRAKLCRQDAFWESQRVLLKTRRG